MVLNFLTYRDETWLAEAHDRHLSGRMALGQVTDANDPNAVPFLIASAAIRDLRGELHRRQQATP